MHLWGMDDTTEYYMFYEGEILSEFYQPTEKIAEFDQGHKEYYWGNKILAKKYKELLKKSPLKNNELGLYQLKNQTVYILPYWNKIKAKRFYVIHLFANNGQLFSGNKLKNIFTLLMVVFLVGVFMFMIKTNRQVSKQIKDFHQWLQAITDKQQVDNIDSTLPTNFNFIELTDTAKIVQTSLKEQLQLQHAERKRLKQQEYFLSSLSHELKTPLAIISAATSLMAKRNELNEKDQNALNKLIKATKKMQQLTQILLQLWRQQPSRQGVDKFSLANIVEQAIMECQQHFSEQKIHFNVTLIASENCLGLKSLAMIVIDNLIRNACQYSNTAEVIIVIDRCKLFVSNQYNEQYINEPLMLDAVVAQEQMYGFGLGLYLVDKICNQQSWLFNVNMTENEFNAQINFAANKIIQ